MAPGTHGWAGYHRNTAIRPPNTLLVQAVTSRRFSGNNALDLGCGSGRDTIFLLKNGFNVTAVDAADSVEAYFVDLPRDQVTFVASRLERFMYVAGEFDLVNAQYVLPYVPRDVFSDVLAAIKSSLRPGGIFVGQLFGDRLVWNVPGTLMTLHNSEEVIALFAGMELEYLLEIERPGITANGAPVYWHRFDVIARRV
jgi:tellurite methyltransferase